MNNNCVFCKIANGELPCHKLWEDEQHIAFLSIHPNTEGFTIVMPKKHLPSYAFENTDRDLSNLVIATKKAARILDTYFDDVARCGMFFEGFGVDHLHSKLFPMHGTGGMEEWKKIESNIPHVFFDKYPGYLSSHDAGRADDEKLSKLAEGLRKTAEKLGIT